MIFKNVTMGNDTISASIEIFVMLLGAFLLGMLFMYILKKDTAPQEYEAGINDLQIIEGIGPKIEKVLNDNGITSFRHIMDVGEEGLRGILEEQKGAIKNHNPITWPDQARLAYEERWEELRKYQDILGSKDIKKKNTKS